MNTRKSTELTLRDKLSRLTLRQAVKLLGPDGEQLIRLGGKFDIVDFPGQARLSHDRFELRLPEAQVTISLKDDARRRLHWRCDACSTACEHAGAAFSTILEEKMALGLAAPPPERTPVENLGERELVRQAMDARRERARDEKMILKSAHPKKLWTDYIITSAVSGKSYRVSVRGWKPGEWYCSCPDFAKNTLGTCKHVLNALDKLKRRFPASTRLRPYTRTNISLHLRYGPETVLRLLLPDGLDRAAERIVRPLRDRAITDIHDLLLRIRRLEKSGRDVTIYPDAEEYIQQRLFQERIENTVAEIRANPKTHALRKTLLKTELLPYQLDGIAFAVGAGRAVLADDMGLGKTVQGIGIAEMLAREADARKVLIVCPASVKSQWRSEIHRFSERDCQLVLGSARSRARQYANGSFFTVCNYEQVLRDILAIEQTTWDLIILDEGQRIKNWEAKTSRVIKGLKSPFAVVLSGTPLENRLDDLFSVVEFIDDRRLGPAFRFFNRHRVVDERGKVLGYKSLGNLRKNLEPILLRRTRDSVLQELPPRTTEIIRITPTDEQLQLHGANMQIVVTITSKKFISEMDLLRLQKALLMCRMTANSTFLVDKQPPGYSTKLEQLILERGRKIVLFSEWTTMLTLIEPLLKKRRVRFVRLDGSVPQKKRQQLVHEFQNDPRCTLFITTNAGATGLNLQAANTVINVDLPWNPAILEQRVGRAHRMGQKRPVQVFVLVTEQTIEENLLATLSAKHQLALAALDPESDVDAVDLATGIEELKRRLEILLGARPEASVDESQKADREQEAVRLAQQEKVARAGGQLVGAAFTFLAEMIPSQEETEASRELTGLFRSRLANCMEKDEQGRPQLTVTLPDSSALDALAGSLARLLAREVSV